MKRNYLLTLLCVLVAISVNAELRTQPVERFNSTTTFDGTDLDKVSNGVYSNSANHVTFTIDNLSGYNGKRLQFNNVGKNSSKTSNFAWIADKGYNVQVTGISGKVRGYQAKISTKNAYAKFNSGKEVKCNTNSTGRDGASDISISDGSGLSNPVVLTLRAEGNSTDFTMHSIVYTYRVTQDVPVFQYKSIASGSEGGDVYSSWESGKATDAEATHEKYDANVTNAASGLVQTAFFKAVPRTGYVFIGWKRKADDVDYVSTSAEYSEELISKSNDNAKPATITLYAVFSAKNTPLFSGSNQTLNVGANQVTDFAFQYTSFSVPSADTNADFYYTIDQNPDATTKEGSEDATQVVSYDPATNTLTGLNSGTAVITFTQNESANYYAASQSYNITVNKNTGTLTNNLGAAYKVDDAVNIVDCYTASNSEVEVQVASSNTDVIAVVEGKLKALSVGTATVTFKQAETYKWTELTASQEITVTKYDLSASISQSAATWDATINNPFAISYDLNDYTVEALDPTIATYTEGAIQTYTETGTARFVISRAEDYKYNQLAETLSISVAPAQESCVLFTDNAERTANYEYVLPDAGAELTIQIKHTWSAINGNVYLKGYTNEGTEVETILSLSTKNDLSSDYKTFTHKISPLTRKIQFTQDGGTYSRYAKNLSVTRAPYFSPSETNKTIESTIGTDAKGTIQVQYNSCGATVKVVSDNPKITVSPTSFYADGSGTQEIILTGDATVLGTETATITIYDQSKKTTVDVTCTITRIPQTITWNSGFENLDVFSTVALEATASGETEVFYSIAEGDQEKASIDGNVLSFHESGTVRVVASAAQSEIYEGVSDTVSVVVHLAQPVVSVLPIVEAIAYGTALTDEMLLGGVAMYGESTVEGSFAWADEQITDGLTPNTYSFNVRFTPADATHYSTIDSTVEVTVEKAQQAIVWQSSFADLNVLSEVSLSATAQTAVRFEVSDSEVATITGDLLTFLKAGVVDVVAIAAESDLYQQAADTIKGVVIAKIDPVVSQWPSATLTYGKTLMDVMLSGKSDIEGTFQWGESVTEEDLAAVKTAETYTYDVKFVPTEGGLFNTLYGKATITIVEATQTISWENAPTACKVGERIALKAVASSGLAVEYYVDQMDNYAMIDAERNELVALAKGAIQLRVRQAGEAGKYAAAEDLVLTISIEAGNTTATEQVSANEQVMVRKVLRDGVLYILRGGMCYDINGRLIGAE